MIISTNSHIFTAKFSPCGAPVRHYFPGLGGGLSCAGAHHGDFTPLEVLSKLRTRVSLWVGGVVARRFASTVLTVVEFALHLILPSVDAKKIAQVVLAHSVCRSALRLTYSSCRIFSFQGSALSGCVYCNSAKSEITETKWQVSYP